MEHGTEDHRTRLTHIVRGKLSDLAQNKYAPYVMQKVLTYGGVENRNAVLEALIGNPILPVILAGDRFGLDLAEYVLQTVSPQDKVEVLGQLSGMSEPLCKSRYGKKLVELAVRPMN